MKRKILVLSSLYNYHQSTQFIQYLSAYPRLSRHDFYFHNFVYDFDPKRIEFDSYDTVIVPHNFWPLNLSEEQVDAFAKTRTLKAVFLQDEYQQVNSIADVLDRMKIDLIFTCVNPEDHDFFYSKRRISSLKGVHQVLTGYVDDQLRRPGLFGFDKKPIDVGFRGRISPYYLGELGHQKLKITQMFEGPAKRAGLNVNISVNESDRLSGDRWLEFLRSCRTQLGTPSGSSVIDFDGRIIKQTASYRRAFPKADFETVREDVFARQDGRVVIDTISPRMLESAATGSALVQLEGRYGGFLAAGEHYIELKEDYSNISDVILQIKDEDLVRGVATRAHDHLIKSGLFDFERHIAKFDDIIDTHTLGIGRRPTPNKATFYQDQIYQHGQNFTVGNEGVDWLDTLMTRKMRRENERNDALRQKFIVGDLLKKAGGDPAVKYTKGKVALGLVKAFPKYRNLLLAACFFPHVSFDRILREIFVLGIIQATQVGMTPTGQIFRSRIVNFEDGDVGIETRSAAQKDSSHPSLSLRDLSLPKLSKGALWVDFRKTFPLGDFASTVIVPVMMGDISSDLRSDPYMRHTLSAIQRIGRVFPTIAKGALGQAVNQPKNEATVRESLRRAFETSID